MNSGCEQGDCRWRRASTLWRVLEEEEEEGEEQEKEVEGEEDVGEEEGGDAVEGHA